MTLAWNPELLRERNRFCAEFEHRCLICGKPVTRRGLSAQIVVMVAERHFAVSEIELQSPRRNASLVEARAFVVWALRSLGRAKSYPEIGAVLNRDASSIVHLHRKAVELRLIDNDFDAACRGLGQRWLEMGERRHARCS